MLSCFFAVFLIGLVSFGDSTVLCPFYPKFPLMTPSYTTCYERCCDTPTLKPPTNSSLACCESDKSSSDIVYLAIQLVSGISILTSVCFCVSGLIFLCVTCLKKCNSKKTTISPNQQNPAVVQYTVETAAPPLYPNLNLIQPSVDSLPNYDLFLNQQQQAIKFYSEQQQATKY